MGGYAFEFGDQPAVVRILDRMQPCSFSYRILSPLAKDSQEVTDADRETLCRLIDEADESMIVVTHGTDTMIETARCVEQKLKNSNKTIVFTGAMRPERFGNSDAPVHLGAAIAAVQLLKEQQPNRCRCCCCCHVAMHGVVRPADQAARDLTTGRFL